MFLSCILPFSVPFLYLVLLYSCPKSCLFYSLLNPFMLCPCSVSTPVSFPLFISVLYDPLLFYSCPVSCPVLFLFCILSCSFPVLSSILPVLFPFVSSPARFLSCILPVLLSSVSSPAMFLVCILPVLFHSISSTALFLTCILSWSIYFCILASSLPVLYLAWFIPSVSVIPKTQFHKLQIRKITEKNGSANANRKVPQLRKIRKSNKVRKFVNLRFAEHICGLPTFAIFPRQKEYFRTSPS